MNLCLVLLLFGSVALCHAKPAKLTFYWVVFEEEYPEGTEASIPDCKGGVLAKTSAKFLKDLTTEGSGKLRNGKFVNYGCKKGFKYSKPIGNHENELVPFVSVATKTYKWGMKILIDELKDFKLPNGKRHNGCVRVDDTGPLQPGQLDFYVLRKKYYHSMDKKLKKTHVNITENANCKPLTYGE